VIQHNMNLTLSIGLMGINERRFYTSSMSSSTTFSLTSPWDSLPW
jgi:hypothetical protein